MKKRVLSALLVLCMACGLVSTAWAADGQATRETAEKPGIMLLNAEDVDQQTASDPTATPAPTAEPTAEPSATPDATEAPEATATPAPENSENADAEPTATPSATPDTTAGEAEPVEYTAALEQDGQALNVVVTAPAGAFGEDVQPTLNVTAIEDETQAADIEAKLAENDIEYDGFAALDISFTDADGNEIEPSEPVTVRIELPDSIIDSGIDLNTLAVQHFAEDEAGNVTSVDQVASVADNTIVLSDEAKAAMEAQAAENAADPESTEEAGPAPMMLAPAANNALTADNGEAEETEAPVVAEFEVDGFSTFTITWQEYHGFIIGSWEDVATTSFVIIDATTGEELLGSGEVTDFNKTVQGTEAESSELAPYVQNYTFVKAVVATDGNSAVQSGATQVTDIGVQETRGGSYKLQYYKSGWFGGSWEDVNNNQKIYFLYSKDTTGSTGGGGGDVEVDLPKPSISKTAIRNDDGETYSLNLSVTGGVGNQTSTTNVDVLLVVDESNSMDSGRIANTKTAIKSLIDSLESQERLNARYSIYTFGDDARDEMSGWQTMPANYVPNPNVSYNDRAFRNTTVGGAVNGIRNSGEGTNYQAALDAAAAQIATARDDAITVVVFLSDGGPSLSYNWGTGTSVMSSNSFWAWRETLETADDIYCDQFYSIGISTDMEEFMGDSNEGYGGLINAVNASTKVYRDTDSEGNNLSNIFAGIGGNVTNLYIEDITIHDNLNLTNVEQVPNTDISVAVTNSDGETVLLNEVGLNEDMIRISYSDDTGLTFSIPDYQLKPGYTYTVTMQIQPTEEAKKEYATTGQYPDTPTAGVNTGTHTGDKGFYSNTEAKLSYYYTENDQAEGEQTLTYPMPVVQVPEVTTGSLTITKDVVIDNEGASQANGTQFFFRVTKLADDSDDPDTNFAGTYSGIQFSQGVSKSNITVTGEGNFTISDLPEGRYKVEELNPPAIANYGNPQVTYSTTSGIVEVSADQTISATVTNTYTRLTHTLTIKKDVTGELGDTNRAFTFTTTGIPAGTYNGKQEVLNDNGDVTEYTAIQVQLTVDQTTDIGSFTLKDGQSVTFTLPEGVEYTVTEDIVDGYDQHADLTSGDGEVTGCSYTVTNLTKDTEVTFTNHKGLVGPPTGLDRNDTPYALMVTAAGIAGLALIGAVVNRRIRRRREE